MVSAALALAFVPLALALLLRYRAHVALLLRGLRAALRARLSGVSAEQRAWAFLRGHARPGDPRHVLLTFDRWGLSGEPLRCLGPAKGRIVERLVRARAPRRALELGTGLGYGAVLLAGALPPGGQLLTLERDPQRAALAEKVIRLAGFHEGTVQLLVGPPEQLLPQLPLPAELVVLGRGGRGRLPLLRLLESLGLLLPGATVLADRARAPPAAPAFLRYARSSGRYRCRLHRSCREYCPGIPDGIAELCYLGDPAQPELPRAAGNGGTAAFPSAGPQLPGIPGPEPLGIPESLP